MVVEIEWSHLDEDTDPLWSDQLCLYAYLHPRRELLLYIGKADFSTVRKRLHGDHKAQLFTDIEREYRIDQVRVMHGTVAPEEGRRRSSELLADVESLLIKRLTPFGNIQSTRRRISRPGMKVHCVGDWPFTRWRFHDIG